jgi:hypothetical protein
MWTPGIGPSADWRTKDRKEVLPVTYMRPHEAKQFELTNQVDASGDTRFYWKGQLFDTTQMVPFQVFGGPRMLGTNRAIFAMTDDGRIFTANDRDLIQADATGKEINLFHHSSFVGGAPVAGAGELYFTNGVLTGVSNESGHYMPEFIHLKQVLQEFQSRGVDMSTVRVQVHGYVDPVPADKVLAIDDAADFHTWYHGARIGIQGGITIGTPAGGGGGGGEKTEYN